jgi:hypothetical protein
LNEAIYYYLIKHKYIAAADAFNEDAQISGSSAQKLSNGDSTSLS